MRIKFFDNHYELDNYVKANKDKAENTICILKNTKNVFLGDTKIYAEDVLRYFGEVDNCIKPDFFTTSDGMLKSGEELTIIYDNGKYELLYIDKNLGKNLLKDYDNVEEKEE